MPYICPICQAPLKLHQASKGYYCPNKHHFDLAKEGYLNLLPVQHKKSKQPGDSRDMMRARRNFLESGFYQPLAQTLVNTIDTYIESNKPVKLLDMGCGEGYYSRQIEQLSEHRSIELHGLDIAKNAIFAAAKKQPKGRFIVASSQRPPYANHYFDVITQVYAPGNDQEIIRLLAEQGVLIRITPGPRHLWQLKEFIYSQVAEHSININLSPLFDERTTQRLQFEIQPNPEQRLTLLQMTPFAWRANKAIKHAIQNTPELIIETDFIVTMAKARKEID